MSTFIPCVVVQIWAPATKYRKKGASASDGDKHQGTCRPILVWVTWIYLAVSENFGRSFYRGEINKTDTFSLPCQPLFYLHVFVLPVGQEYVNKNTGGLEAAVASAARERASNPYRCPGPFTTAVTSIKTSEQSSRPTDVRPNG